MSKPKPSAPASPLSIPDAPPPEAPVVTPAAAPTPTPEPTPTPAPQPDNAAAAAAASRLSPDELTKFNAEFAEKGNLSDESLDAIEKRTGIPKHMVVQFVEGTRAISERQQTAIVNAVHEAAGGKEGFEAMKTWASSNLSPADKAAYEAAIASGDHTAAGMATQKVHKLYTDQVGTQHTSIHGGRGSTGPQAFRDRSEMVAAMKDPRYETSQAYRDEVTARISASLKQ